MNGNDPMTPEERELARHLGRRLDTAPPAAVDAAILAAARNAVQATPTPARQDAPAQGGAPAALPRRQYRRRRWPAVSGIAASVVFAVGLAWQMRPEPPPVQRLESAPAPMEPAPAAAPIPAPAAQPRAQESPPAMPPAPAPSAPAPQAAEADAAMHDSAEPTPRAASAAPTSDTLPTPAAASTEARSQRLAEPASAYAAQTADTESTTTDGGQDGPQQAPLSRQALKPAPAASARAVGAAPASAPGIMQRRTTAPLSADDVRAEVLADATLARRQWLQKIRQRRDAGQIDLARASLERYLLQYPESRLPRDLQPLLAD